MMYGLTFFWSVLWIYADSTPTATIHSRFSWGFLPQVAQVKTRRRQTKDMSDLILRVARAASIILSFTIWAMATLILISFLRNILSQVQYILSPIISPNTESTYPYSV